MIDDILLIHRSNNINKDPRLLDKGKKLLNHYLPLYSYEKKRPLLHLTDS